MSKRMKKIFPVFLAIALILSLSACGAEERAADQSADGNGSYTAPQGASGVSETESGAASGENGADGGMSGGGIQAPSVFMTEDISAEGLTAVYEALEASPSGNIAVKISTGEAGEQLSPDRT